MVNEINKLVGYVVNPLAIGMLILVVGMIFRFQVSGFRRWGWMGLAFAWFWFWGMPVTGQWLGYNLEKDYPVKMAEEMPTADAIVLMGGGVWGSTNYPYACLTEGADRAWHAARLWKSGKAPIIIPSNTGAEFGDVKLLVDLGVPREAVVLENEAVNTEENAKNIVRLFDCSIAGVPKIVGRKPRILLVTSAIHMRRSVYMFEKYASRLEVIPAATDYCVLPWIDEPWDFRAFIPNVSMLSTNNSFLHEYIGYWGYRVFR